MPGIARPIECCRTMESAAEQHYRSAAQRNHASAQLALGDLIAQRAANEADWSEAARWYRLAADGGHEAERVAVRRSKDTAARGRY